ncbi:hypothetical protein ACH4OY_21520 [Micromonospora rubida]|uniref:Uncharacterized protein n=1 Tax=Micromonospora rubida TaxID=2697657 RepID=A0ABW7SQ15_9ACTN
MTTYTVMVVNNSSWTNPVFAIFAQIPEAEAGQSRHNLAWLTQAIAKENTYLFQWNTSWGLTWARQGVARGKIWQPSRSAPLPVDPADKATSHAEFTHNGDFQLAYQDGNPDGERIFVHDSGTTPTQDKAASSVALTLYGRPVCATETGPNLLHEFTTTLTYFIAAGDISQGLRQGSLTRSGFPFRRSRRWLT